MMASRSSLSGGRAVRLPLVGRVSPVAAMAGVAGLSAIANAIAVAAPPSEAAPTRLGTSISQSAQERDEAFARQRRAIDMREQALKASEARLKADLASRQPGASAAMPPGGRPGADQGETPYDDLARIYQTMKPARAAPIFERLDLDVQIAVARRMRERSTALIMAGMSPNGAVRLSMAMAGKRVEIPVAARAPEATAPATPAKSAKPAMPVKAPAPVGSGRPKAAEQAAQPASATAQKS